ncbi:MAG: DUF3857 domain-containing protein [Puniceicoccales bacterium]|jgi:hypothetical protein|nr:DUF3857 domain-containing protein [Puniceicoccales bacterium]
MTKLFFTLTLALVCFSVSAFEVPEKYKGSDYVILEDTTHVDVQDSGLSHFKIKQRLQILTQKGALKWRIIKYDYDPLTAAAEFSKVTVIRPETKRQRKVPVVSQKDYAAPARSIYWGARQKLIEIGEVKEGDIIEYEIFKKGFTYALLKEGDAGAAGSGGGSVGSDDEERFVPPMRGEFYDIVPFWAEVPVETKIYSVNLPANKDLQYEFFQGECSVSVKPNADKRLYTFTKKDIIPAKKEKGVVNEFDYAPKLFMSTTRDWRAKSLWFHKVNEDYGSFAAFPAAQTKVDELLKGVTDEWEKVSILTHWVADNMRYSGLSMGRGEGFTLHNTEMNFVDMCGVCKDKAALLISLLRMAGFESYPAMTMAGSRIEQIPADHFNHCVTVVKMSDGKYHPLDPTWVPFVRELWSSAEQQQHYLPGIPEGSDLLETPVSPPENHYVRINAQSSLDKEGTLEGEFTIVAEGQSDSTVRRIFTRSMMSEWQDNVEQELLNVSPQAQLLSVEYGKNPRDYIAGPVSITMKFRIPNYALVGTKEVFLTPLTVNNLFSRVKTYLRLGDEKERKYPFKDACSRLVELTETITLPDGYKLVTDAPFASGKNDTAEYTTSLRQEGNALKFYNLLVLKKRVYEASEWPAFLEAVNQQRQFSENPLVIRTAPQSRN